MAAPFAVLLVVVLPASCRHLAGGLDDIVNAWATLSPATQELLTPFLVPPAYVGSWANQTAMAQPARRAPLAEAGPDVVNWPCRLPTLDANWAAEPATDGGRVKVWYDTRIAGERSKASNVVGWVETTQSGPHLGRALAVEAQLRSSLDRHLCTRRRSCVRVGDRLASRLPFIV